VERDVHFDNQSSIIFVSFFFLPFFIFNGNLSFSFSFDHLV